MQIKDPYLGTGIGWLAALLVTPSLLLAQQREFPVGALKPAVDYLVQDLRDHNLLGERRVILDMSVPGAKLNDRLRGRAPAAIGLPTGNFQTVVSCPPVEAVGKRCSMPEDTVILSVVEASLNGDTAVVEVTSFLPNDRGKVFSRFLKLELVRESGAWGVTRVLGTGMGVMGV